MNNNSQIYLPKLTLINKVLIIISAVVFIANFALLKISATTLGPMLGLSAAGVFSGYLHTLVTYPFLSHSILEVILNGLMLWLMGSEFESNWGQKRYLSFLLTTIVGGALVYLLVVAIFFQGSPVYTFPLSGLAGVVGALCLAYAVIYPDRIFSFMMLIPVKAKYFCMILVVISLYQGVSGPMGVGAWGQLGAILSAYLFMVAISNRNFRSLADKVEKMTQARSLKKSKAKLSIVKDDNEQPPKYWQ